MSKLIDLLVGIQSIDLINDTKFAKRMGISRRLWGRTKQGDIVVGITLLKAIIRTYPDLIPDIITFLRGDNDHHQASKQ